MRKGGRNGNDRHTLGHTQTFLLGARELLSMDSSVELDVYSPTSPLGEAIVGKSAGDTTSYVTPTGVTISVKILNAKPFVG